MLVAYCESWSWKSVSRKGLLHHLAICLEEATTSAEEPPTNHRLKSHTIIDHPILSPARWLSKDSTPHPQAGRWGLVIVSGWFQDPKRCISPFSAACKGKTQGIILEVHLVAFFWSSSSIGRHTSLQALHAMSWITSTGSSNALTVTVVIPCAPRSFPTPWRGWDFHMDLRSCRCSGVDSNVPKCCPCNEKCH